MKTNKFFLTLATLMVCVSSVFISCSNDDDNNGNSKELGDNAVAALKNILLNDDDGTIVFGEPNEDGIYMIGLNGQDAAKALVAKYVNNANYTGDATIYTLPDGRGTVRVEKGTEEGIYYTVTFAVQEIPQLNQMTLEVVDANYMDNENVIAAKTPYKCNKCGETFKLFAMEAKKCTSCGSTNIEKIK